MIKLNFEHHLVIDYIFYFVFINLFMIQHVCKLAQELWQYLDHKTHCLESTFNPYVMPSISRISSRGYRTWANQAMEKNFQLIFIQVLRPSVIHYASLSLTSTGPKWPSYMRMTCVSNEDLHCVQVNLHFKI